VIGLAFHHIFMKVVRECKAANFEKDAFVVFKSEEFPISSLLFSGLSAKFKREFANRRIGRSGGAS
jgi:hypothetical protein